MNTDFLDFYVQSFELPEADAKTMKEAIKSQNKKEIAKAALRVGVDKLECLIDGEPYEYEFWSAKQDYSERSFESYQHLVEAYHNLKSTLLTKYRRDIIDGEDPDNASENVVIAILPVAAQLIKAELAGHMDLERKRADKFASVFLKQMKAREKVAA